MCFGNRAVPGPSPVDPRQDASATAFVIGLVALVAGVAIPPMMLVTVAAGFVGTNADSLVGAVFENWGLIGNSGTNLVATIAGGVFAALFFLR